MVNDSAHIYDHNSIYAYVTLFVYENLCHSIQNDLKDGKHMIENIIGSYKPI